MSLKSNLAHIFISCADEDIAFLEGLERQLSSMTRERHAQCWHRHKISPGSEWRERVKQYLHSADIILLLVSPSFIASDYCYEEEALPAMVQHKSGKACVIPVIVQPVEWEKLIFGGLKSLPIGEAVSMWSNREDAFSNIVRGVRDAIDDLRSKVRDIKQGMDKPLSIWNVPYWRNPLFTGREEVLADLQRAFASPQTSLHLQALSGLAGVGKTHVAVEYAHRYASNYQAVLWTSADSPESLLSSIGDLANILDLPERNEANQPQIVRAVKQWLQQNSSWLLIIDNLEDIDLLQDVVPSQHSGHILITTRTHRTGHFVHRVDLSPMQIDDSALLLLRRAKRLTPHATLAEVSETDSNLAKEIAQATGGLPLALDQAGAYIEETGRSLADYMGLYQTHSSSLLKRRGASSRDHPASVTTTFSLAYEKLKTQNPTSVELLEFCAFLHPDAIFEEMLVDGAVAFDASLCAIVTDPIEFDRAIEDLLKFALLRRESDSNVLIVHRLVQAVVRENMDEEKQKRVVEQVIRALDIVFPLASLPNWSICQKYLPQAQTCAELIQQRKIVLPEAAHLLHKIAHYLLQRGRYTEIEPFGLRALSLREQVQETDDLDMALSLDTLAEMYHQLGKYADTETFRLRALAMREKALGTEHPDVATNLYHLGRVYLRQDRDVEAEQLYQRVLTMREKILGPEHLDVAASLGDLGVLFHSQGKYAEAESFQKRALAIKEKVLDAGHNALGVNLLNLGILCLEQEKYDESEPLLLRALAIYEQKLGPEHPYVALTLYQLGNLMRLQERYNEAEQFYQRTLAIQEKTLGSAHARVAFTLENLADIYYKQGQYVQAKPLVQRALMIYEQVFGLEHQKTLAMRERYSALLQE